MPREHGYRSREEMRHLVLQLLALTGRPMSRAEIAYAIGRQKAPHINAFLDELVEQGVLERSVKIYRTKAKGFVYKLRSDSN